MSITKECDKGRGRTRIQIKGHPDHRIERSPELFDQIIQLLIDGNSLPKIVMMPGMPSRRAISNWRLEDAEFGRRVDEARKINLEFLVEDMLSIARTKPDDELDAKGKRLYMDTLKWYACKLAPKIYGEKLAMTDADGGNLPPTEIRVTMVRPPVDDSSTS